MVLNSTRDTICFNNPCFHSKRLNLLIGFLTENVLGLRCEKEIKKKKNRNSVMEKWKFVETAGNLVSFVISVQSVKKKQKNKKRKAIDNMKVI